MNKQLKSIVLIDDQESNNFLSEMVLEDVECGAHVKSYLSAEEALTDIENELITPDLIFLDINMPSMNGWEFLSKYESKHLGKEIPIVVMLSSSNNEDDIARSQSFSSVKDYVTKPLSEEYCRKIVEKFPALESLFLRQSS